MREREVDRLDPVVVFLGPRHIREAPDPVVRLDAELGLQRRDEGAEHVDQHALALGLEHREHFHVDHGREHQRPAAVDLGAVVDLVHRLVRLVHAVDEGQADAVRLDLELGQDGVGKGLGRDAGAVGDEESGAVRHLVPTLGSIVAKRTARSPRGPYNVSDYPELHSHAAPRPHNSTTTGQRASREPIFST